MSRNELAPNLWEPQKIIDKETGNDVSILLSPFFTNTDKSIFVMRNLPPLTEGALFSRFSRSDAPDIRQVFYDEFLSPEVKADFRKDPKKVEGEIAEFLRLQDHFVNEKRAIGFYKRVLAEFGDYSVGYMTGAHVAMLNISSWASFVTSDPRVGIDPITKSSRFIALDRKINGRYQYYRDPQIMESRFADQFTNAMDLLFATYSKMLPEMISFLKERVPIQSFVYKNKSFADAERTGNEKEMQSFIRSYDAAAKGAALDAIRGLLPAGVLLSKGFRGNGVAWENLLNKMYASPLHEMQALGRGTKHELDSIIQELVSRVEDEKGAASQEYLRKRDQAVRYRSGLVISRQGEVNESELPKALYEGKYVTLVDAEDNALAELNVFSALLTDQYSLREIEARHRAARMSNEEKEIMIRDMVSGRKNRMEKLSRGFENTSYRFEFRIPLSEIRDLHRNKMMTRSVPQLTVKYGYDVPEEVRVLGAKKEYVEAIQAAEEVFRSLSRVLPDQAGYAVTFAHKHPFPVRINLRSADYTLALRSAAGGNPVYRRAAQEAHDAIMSVHPLLGSALNLVDHSHYELGRFWQQMRSEEKKAAIK